jgi:hypothetical protein
VQVYRVGGKAVVTETTVGGVAQPSGPLYELEGLLVNIVSVRGSEENNIQGLGGKLPATPIIVIDGASIEWRRIPEQ